MIVDIQFNPKEQSAILTYELANFATELNKKECLAIITIVSADFYLDPEIELEHLDEFLKIAQEQDKSKLVFEISEDGVDLQLK